MITVVILDIVVIDVTEWLFGKHLKTGNYYYFNGLRVWPKNFPIYFQIYRLLKMAFRNKPD